MPATYEYSFFSSTPKIENGKWIYLFPSVALSAVGAACVPHFALGLAIGACQYVISLTLGIILKNWMPNRDANSIYANFLRENITVVTLLGPLFEELFFRGLLQPLLLLTIGALFSLSLTDIFSDTTINTLLSLFICKQLEWLNWAMLGLLMALILINSPQLISIIMFGATINATSVSMVCVTAILFGLLHLGNPHENAPIQTILATLAGVTFGVLALQYGLWASIAAHIMVNTLATLGIFIGDEYSLQEHTAATPCSMT